MVMLMLTGDFSYRVKGHLGKGCLEDEPMDAV